MIKIPNWCSSDMWVTIKPKNKEERKLFPKILKRFIEQSEGENGCLDMEKFIPYPKEYADADKRHAKDPTVADGYNHGGYEWCVTARGSKWNFSDPKLVKQTKLTAIYGFETPWCPPMPVIYKMSEMFPDLEFKLRYYEAGMAFQGVFIIKSGIVSKNEQKEYHGWRGG